MILMVLRFKAISTHSNVIYHANKSTSHTGHTISIAGTYSLGYLLGACLCHVHVAEQAGGQAKT